MQGKTWQKVIAEIVGLEVDAIASVTYTYAEIFATTGGSDGWYKWA